MHLLRVVLRLQELTAPMLEWAGEPEVAKARRQQRSICGRTYQPGISGDRAHLIGGPLYIIPWCFLCFKCYGIPGTCIPFCSPVLQMSALWSPSCWPLPTCPLLLAPLCLGPCYTGTILGSLECGPTFHIVLPVCFQGHLHFELLRDHLTQHTWSVWWFEGFCL